MPVILEAQTVQIAIAREAASLAGVASKDRFSQATEGVNNLVVNRLKTGKLKNVR